MTTCMIYATVGSPKEAQNLAKTLVEERLVACVNILGGATSVYRWEDNVESETESIFVAKTSKAKCVEAMRRLKDLHSYDTPCIVSYDMSDGLPEYIEWILAETDSD